jgi:hypothetical protein
MFLLHENQLGRKMQALHVKNLTKADLDYIDEHIGEWFFYFNTDSYTGITRVVMQSTIPAHKLTLLRLKFADRMANRGT